MARNDGKERVIKIIWHSLVRYVCALVFCTACRIKTYGTENVPKGEAALVLCNHQSYIDPFFSQSWFCRHFYFVARQTLYVRKILGPILRSLLIIPIKQGEGDISAMKAIISKLKEGKMICLYPEGSRTFDGRIIDVKPGFALLSRRGKAKIIPTVIEGAFEFWPRTKKWPKPTRVSIMYGEPIEVETVKELGDREFARFLTRKLRQMQNELRVKMGREPFDYPDMDPDQGEAVS